MRPGLRFMLILWTASLVLASSVGSLWGLDNPKPPPGTVKFADQQIYDLLKDVINRGADLYNSGDRNGCYRLFQGALMATKPQLADRPELQRAIDEGMADAERQGSTGERAYVLRRVLDDIRAKTNPKAKQKTAEAATEKRPDVLRPPQPQTQPPPPPGTLWERLGGETGVKKIIDDFVALAGPDPKVNFSRNGKYKLDTSAVTHLKGQLLDFFSQATGGLYLYHGKSMKEAHRGMAITDAEFDALAADLQKALQKNGVKSADIDLVMKAIGSTRADIVEPLKPPEPKPPEKKSVGAQ